MQKEIIDRNAQVPISGAVRKGNFLFVSGQVPRGAEKGDIGQQTRLVLDRIKTLVEKAGGTLNDVVKVTVFLKRREDFKGMNEVYAQFFKDDFPARTAVKADLMAEEYLVEIDALAILDKG